VEATQPEASDPGGPSLFERITSHWLVSWILVPAALIFFLHYFIFSAYHVVGSSMTPTLQDSNYLIIAKVDHTKALIEGKKYIPPRGEIIVFHYPKQPTLDFVKRVIGLPGERVVIKDGKVRIYNAQHPEGFDPDQTHAINGTYTLGDVSDNPLDVTVPEGNIFVLGDNRLPNGSSDSREWGFLPSDNIVGNVVLRLFPFNEIKTF
jgi:signal peptidase I